MNMWKHLLRLNPQLPVCLFMICIIYTTGITKVAAEPIDSYIQVYGQGEVSAVPDMANLTAVISETDLQLDSAQALVKEKVADVLALLKRFAIKEGSLDSSQVSINPKYDYRTNRQNPILLGYEVNQTVSFSLENLEQLGSLISHLSQAKIDRMHGIQFEHSQRKRLLDQALLNAIQHSKELAGSIADQYGVSLGSVLQVEYLTPDAQSFSSRTQSSLIASEASIGSYQHKELEFKARIKATFSFK